MYGPCIEKGKPFNPDARTKEILKEGVKQAHAWLDDKYDSDFPPPYYENTHWALLASQEVVQGLSTISQTLTARSMDAA